MAYQLLIYHTAIYSKIKPNSANKSAPDRPPVKFTTLLYHPSNGVLLWFTEQWKEHMGDTGPFFNFVIYEQYPNKQMYTQWWSYKVNFIFPINTMSMYIITKLIWHNWCTCLPCGSRGGQPFIDLETRGAGCSCILISETVPKQSSIVGKAVC